MKTIEELVTIFLTALNANGWDDEVISEEAVMVGVQAVMRSVAEMPIDNDQIDDTIGQLLYFEGNQTVDDYEKLKQLHQNAAAVIMTLKGRLMRMKK